MKNFWLKKHTETTKQLVKKKLGFTLRGVFNLQTQTDKGHYNGWDYWSFKRHFGDEAVKLLTPKEFMEFITTEGTHRWLMGWCAVAEQVVFYAKLIGSSMTRGMIEKELNRPFHSAAFFDGCKDALDELFFEDLIKNQPR